MGRGAVDMRMRVGVCSSTGGYVGMRADVEMEADVEMRMKGDRVVAG